MDWNSGLFFHEMIAAKKLATEFFLEGAKLAMELEVGTISVPSQVQLNHVALFSQSPVAVWAACIFFPQIPHWLIRLCIWGMSFQGRKGVAARVWLHLAPLHCLNKSECSPSSECAEWQQRDCHSFSSHLECSTSSVLLYPSILAANGEGCEEMLPSTPTACACPKLLLIGDPAAGAWRLSEENRHKIAD